MGELLLERGAGGKWRQIPAKFWMKAQKLRLSLKLNLSDYGCHRTFQNLPERAFKKTVNTKCENNCPQLLLGLLYSDRSCGDLLLNSMPHVYLKAFQRGSEKAGCTLVN